MLGLHIAVFLFGLAGLFSKFLLVPAVVIVWGRTAFAVIASSLYLIIRSERFELRSRTDAGRLAIQGLVLAFHWVAFFHSIQISSVAIGLLSFATFPAFVLLFEAILFGAKVRRIDAFGVALILCGVSLIVPQFTLTSDALWGVVWGVLSAVSFAALTLLNRTLSSTYGAAHISLAQSGVAALVLTPLVLGELAGIGAREWWLLLCLGVFCTALAHTLFIRSLGRVRAFVASIVVSLEPVYGIAAAFVLLGEVPAARELLGGAIIIGATVVIALSPSAKPSQ